MLALLLGPLLTMALLVGDQDLDGPRSPPADTPSGVPAPASDARWQRTFLDDFDHSSLDTRRWSAYRGRPVGQPLTTWRPGEVDVAGGALRLSTTRRGATSWWGGGVSSAVAGGQTYGKWSVRLRAQPGAGVGYVVLLYPVGGAWPPEVDVAEDSGGDRDGYRSTLHYSAQNRTIGRLLDGVDMTRWHTVGVELEPGRITYLLDERVWAVVDTPDVPDVPMWVGVQTAANACTATATSCVSSATPASSVVEVDWIARYSSREEVTRTEQ